jgi:nitroimidazol reductase NimA-like FMN-containing flavoprotein (pyridoxamine 5'-phosphate oxidase superfamily)
MTTTHDEPVTELSAEECWELLALEEFGRLAYRLVDEVHLVPINYLADAGVLLFQTASGNKLLAAALHSDVAFEIDWHDDRTAWSVVVRGRLRRLPEDEVHRVEGRLHEPWVPALRYDVVEVVPNSVSGRRFRLRGSGPGAE